MSQPTDLVVTRPAEDLTVVALPELCLAEASLRRPREQLIALADGIGDGELHLDFSEVTYLDSTALAALVALHRRAEQTHGRLVCCNLAADLLKLFRLTRLDTILDVRPKEPRA
jgi:anti-anti-sigma factor